VTCKSKPRLGVRGEIIKSSLQGAVERKRVRVLSSIIPVKSHREEANNVLPKIEHGRD
jgi:hypothetical protein